MWCQSVTGRLPTLLPLCFCLLPYAHPFVLQVCKYIDMPLQHINNLTLLAMNRPPQAHTKALLHKLRDNIPGLVLRTTFISGVSWRQCGHDVAAYW